MMRPRLLAALSVAALELAPGCGRDNTETASFSGGPHPATITAGSTSTGSSGDTSTSTGSTSTSSSGGSGSSEDSASTAAASASTFDMGSLPDFDLPPIGCQGKIDFLFVIDSEFEAKHFQLQLQAAFPAFVDILEQDLADFDYQIMVVDAGTSALLPNCYDCYMMCDACQEPGCPEDYPCDGQFVECDITEGAGVTITGNFGASNKRCELATEHRYITTADAATLEKSFQCIATLGEGPKTPVAMESLMSALAPDMLNGGCNDGFVRHGALLVVVVIQGVQDKLSPGTPQSWYDTLVTVKGGNEEAVVVLVMSNDLDLPNPKCDQDDKLFPNPLRVFAQEVAAHGLFESVCADTYVPFLEQGASLALDQCALLVPQ